MNRMNNNDCRLFARPEIHNQDALSFGHEDLLSFYRCNKHSSKLS